MTWIRSGGIPTVKKYTFTVNADEHPALAEWIYQLGFGTVSKEVCALLNTALTGTVLPKETHQQNVKNDGAEQIKQAETLAPANSEASHLTEEQVSEIEEMSSRF